MAIYNIKIAKKRCKPELTLTAPTCPACTIHLLPFQCHLCFRQRGNHGMVDFHPGGADHPSQT